MVAITVIMPVYNKAQYIIESIQSVLNQTFTNFELLIVNDGSTDESENVIRNFMKQDKRIKYFKQENKGVAAARNKGISMATGKYITFLDADDLYKGQFLGKMLETIKDNNVAICNYEFKSSGKIMKTKWKCKDGDLLIDYLYNKCIPNTNSWLIKKEFISKFNLRFTTDRNWGEDQGFFIKVLCHEPQILSVKESLTIYNTDIPNSLSENSIDKLFKDILWLSEIKKYIQQCVIDQKRKETALYAIDTYKLPALLIYRLFINKAIIEQRLYEESYNQVKQYINKFRLSNGLRSMKVLLYKVRL